MSPTYNRVVGFHFPQKGLVARRFVPRFPIATYTLVHIQYVGQGWTRDKNMSAVKTTIRDAATLILVARNTKLNRHFDYRVLLLERGAKSAFMVCINTM